jgi:hypothetical protein
MPALEHVINVSRVSRVVRVTMPLQGPPGPMGLPGSSVHQRVAVRPLGGHRLVIAVGEQGADYADAGDVTHFGRVIGMTTGAVAASDVVSVQASGAIDEPSWSWMPDQDVWLGANGMPTQTPPSNIDAVAQRIGFALTPTRLWVDLADPLLIN